MSTRELEVLNVLAGHDKKLTATNVVNETNGLTQSTVIAVLRKLLRENKVEVSGVSRSGKVLARAYTITQTGRHAVLEYLLTELKSVRNIVSLDDIITAWTEEDE